MGNQTIKLYGYRWVVLAVFAFINLIVQLQWLTFAPISQIAMNYYHVSSPLQIDWLSMIFMFTFVVFAIPASWVIDTHGIRLGLGIGAALVGIGSIMKSFYAADYTMVFAAQLLLSIGQPFVMNATTKLTMHWFPVKERASAAGVVSLGIFFGIMIAEILTPILVNSLGHNTDLKATFQLYGVISVLSAIATIALIPERPATPPCLTDQEERFSVMEGLKHMFTHRTMIIMITLFFVAFGIFNAISTVIDQIGSAKGLNADQGGLVGGMIIIGGIVGAGVMPVLSDRMRKRKPFLTIGAIGALPGLIGLTIFKDYSLLLGSAFVLGFFMVSAMPIGFQYCAEVAYPAPESSSQGVTVLAGNLSGILFIFGMDKFGINPFMKAFVVMLMICAFLTTLMKESPMILTESAKASG